VIHLAEALIFKKIDTSLRDELKQEITIQEDVQHLTPEQMLKSQDHPKICAILMREVYPTKDLDKITAPNYQDSEIFKLEFQEI